MPFGGRFYPQKSLTVAHSFLAFMAPMGNDLLHSLCCCFLADIMFLLEEIKILDHTENRADVRLGSTTLHMNCFHGTTGA